MNVAPIRIQEVYRLAQLGINPASFKFGITTFESDKYITIKDTAQVPIFIFSSLYFPHQNGDQQLVIVEFDNNFNTTKKPNRADASLMHPTQNIIALRAKNESANGTIIQVIILSLYTPTSLQVFNMDKKEKLKHLEFLEQVVYWKWVNINKLAIVTATSVYHININNPNEQQVKILDRAGPLSAENPVQIIGYSLEGQEKWCALFGISTPDGGKTINGHIQLFLIEGAKQQLLEGHCCTFGEGYVHSDDYKSSLFCFVEKKAGQQGSKLHVTEIGQPPANQAKFKKFFEIQDDPSFPNDFPVLMYMCSKYGLLFVISKFSFLTVYELSTASFIFRQKICGENVFVGAQNRQTEGYYVIGKEGVVYSINVVEDQLVNYILNSCRHIPDVMQLAFKLASRYKLPGVDNMFIDQFNRLLVAGDIMSAAKVSQYLKNNFKKIAASAPGILLRNPETIAKFKQIPQQPGQPQPLIVYFQILLEKGQLNSRF